MCLLYCLVFFLDLVLMLLCFMYSTLNKASQLYLYAPFNNKAIQSVKVLKCRTNNRAFGFFTENKACTFPNPAI